jgi:hypothetical protein
MILPIASEGKPLGLGVAGSHDANQGSAWSGQAEGRSPARMQER